MDARPFAIKHGPAVSPLLGGPILTAGGRHFQPPLANPGYSAMPPST